MARTASPALAVLASLALASGAHRDALAEPPDPPAATLKSSLPPPAPPPGGPSPGLAAGVAFALAAVGIGVGTAYGVRALEAQRDFDRTPTQALADKQQTSAVISDGSFGAAIVGAVAGAVFVTYRRAGGPVPAAALAARLELVPILSPRAQGAAALLRF